MRIVVNILLVVMVVGLIGGAAFYVREHHAEGEVRDLAREELRRFQQQIDLQSALRPGSANQRAHPTEIDPHWFGGDVPTNPLLPGKHPWVEIAGEDDRRLDHPVNWAVADTSTPRFWYNPFRGVVRARVPLEGLEAEYETLYEYVNETSLYTPRDAEPEEEETP